MLPCLLGVGRRYSFWACPRLFLCCILLDMLLMIMYFHDIIHSFFPYFWPKFTHSWWRFLRVSYLRIKVSRHYNVVVWFSYGLIHDVVFYTYWNCSKLLSSSSPVSNMAGLRVTVFKSLSELRNAPLCRRKRLQFRRHRSRHVRCKHGTVGRFVRLTMRKRRKPLVLCEVEVYGEKCKYVTWL